MNNKQQQLVLTLRAIMSVVFIVIIGLVFLYSQFTGTPLSLETISGLLVILMPYFVLDTVVSYQQINNNKPRE